MRFDESEVGPRYRSQTSIHDCASTRGCADQCNLASRGMKSQNRPLTRVGLVGREVKVPRKFPDSVALSLPRPYGPAMTQTPAGWYPVDDDKQRYWSGTEWTDQVRPVPPSAAPPAPPAAPTQLATEPPRRKRRIFLWVFLAIQILFIVWIIAGVGSTSGDATDCGGLDQETCDVAEDVGASIGVFFIVIFWMMVDFLLAVGYGIYRLAKRP